MNEYRVNVFKQNRFMGNAARRMIMEKCKYEGTGIWNGRCVGTKEVAPCPWYDKCKKYKPNYTTNADYIRSMSDEDLANLLTDYSNNSGWVTEIGRKICFERIYEWLQQPAE